MFKLKNNINQKKNEILIVEILFYIFPLSFLIGNLAISINTLLFIIVSLVFIKKNQLNIRFNKSVWVLVIFFLYFFISTTIQYLYPGFLNSKLQDIPLEVNPILKSFLLARFVLLILVVDTLLYNKILNLKNFFLSSLICTSFVSFDVILQYITGVDLFGYKSFATWNSGPFGDELIAGTYLKNFSLFSLFYIFLYFKDVRTKNTLLIFIITSHLVAMLVAGNRMPIVLFLFGCFLLFLFIKNIRFAMSISAVLFVGIFLFLASNDKTVKKNYKKFFSDINIASIFNKKNETIASDITLEKSTDVPSDIVILRHSSYNRIYRTAITVWAERPLTGFGLKSFRIICWHILDKDNVKREAERKKLNLKFVGSQYLTCATHPHNYYLEILSEAGIIGITLIILFFIFILRNSFYMIKKIYQTGNTELMILTPVIISIILEIWPLRSTGSFFTNTNATFFWLILGMLLSSNIKNLLPKIQ
jgi:O-antigen ligase